MDAGAKGGAKSSQFWGIRCQRDCQRFVGFGVGRGELGESGVGKDADAGSRDSGLQAHGDDGHSHPQGIAGGRAAGIREGIQGPGGPSARVGLN